MHFPVLSLFQQTSLRNPTGDATVFSLLADQSGTPHYPHQNLQGKRVVFAANTSWYLYNHQRNILTAFLEAGCRVFTVSPHDAYSQRLAALGCEVVSLPVVPASRNPLREAWAAAAFFRLYRKIRPDMAVHFTIKCTLYGGFAAARLRIPYINIICGMGSVFDGDNFLNRCVQSVFRFTQQRSSCVFFQSPADLEYMRDRGLVSEAQALLLPGSGVDLKRFWPTPTPSHPPFRFAFAGRMLREKGLSLLAEAMREVRVKHPETECRVYGFLKTGDPRYVSREELDTWEKEGLLKYCGPVDDVSSAYAEADCVVLPTFYREGVPKSLLEAAAMGKPIVTTSQSGCKAVVQDGLNGLLCEPRDQEGLTRAMFRMIAIGPEGRGQMGMQGRRRMEGGFGEERVIRAYLNAASGMLA